MAVGPSEVLCVACSNAAGISHPFPWACLPELQRPIASLWGRKAKLPGRSGRTGWSELFQLFPLLSKILSYERFAFSTWWLWSDKPVLLSCRELRNGVSLQYMPSGRLPQAALEGVMKNTDIFNIKPVSLLVLLLFFKLGFAEYLGGNVYVYTKTHHTHTHIERKKKVIGFLQVWDFVFWFERQIHPVTGP